jgi:hypothetical protein
VNFASSVTEIEICGSRRGAGEPFAIWRIHPPTKTNTQRKSERKKIIIIKKLEGSSRVQATRRIWVGFGDGKDFVQ